MAILYEKFWKLGDKHVQLLPGYHYKQSVRSIVIPEGQWAQFSENPDRTGKQSRKFYEGEYYDLAFYGIKQRPGVIQIGITELRSTDLVEVQNGYPFKTEGKTQWYNKIWKLPVGKRKAGEDFPDNRIDKLKIPFGLVVEVFDKANFDGGSLIFAGDVMDGFKEVDLNEHGYRDKVSSMIITSDEWEPAGIELRNERITESVGKRLGGTGTLANNSPIDDDDDSDASLTKEIEVTREKTITTDWNMEGGISVSAGFEGGVEGGASGVVAKASVGVEVSFSAGYGGSHSETETTRTMDAVTVNVPPMSTRKVSMFVDYGRMEADAVRKLRNKRSGVIVEQTGKITIDYATKTEAEVH